jgi:hypothetical protein
VRFQFLKAASIKMVIVLMMDSVSTSETSVNFYKNTRRNIPEDGYLRIPLCFADGWIKFISFLTRMLVLISTVRHRPRNTIRIRLKR